ncbi:hypothetical protein CDAR_254461 [Caerostris darwini]|uniref:Uncharacterized protein n=1 Tax=Caerostris darwini TaxID=1538125 RepID=A0AAV4UB02_9ARAC|nr:hypothetical protein CDAR_254461 [Caerostris darwini]
MRVSLKETRNRDVGASSRNKRNRRGLRRRGENNGTEWQQRILSIHHDQYNTSPRKSEGGSKNVFIEKKRVWVWEETNHPEGLNFSNSSLLQHSLPFDQFHENSNESLFTSFFF